jgi:penicillin-binding protein 1C
LPGCAPEEAVMELIYPREMERLFIPRQLDGTPGEVIFEVAHRYGHNTTLYWYIDRDYAGSTSSIHQMGLHPSPGWHIVTITDKEGNLLEKRFFVVKEGGGD